MENFGSQPHRRISKPLGVYVIATFDIVAMGVIQLVAFILHARASDEEIPLFLRLLNVGLPVVVIAASVWVATGDDLGRKLLLAAVTMLSSGIIINNLTLLLGGEAAGETVIDSVSYIVRGAFWLGINWWYFLRQSTVAYYKQNR